MISNIASCPSSFSVLSDDIENIRDSNLFYSDSSNLTTVLQSLSVAAKQTPTFIHSNDLNQAVDIYNTRLIVVLFQLNIVPDLSVFFRKVLKCLSSEGYFVFSIEITSQRKNRLLGKLPRGVGHFMYVCDYLLHRLVPRLAFTRPFYKRIFHNTRVVSKAEVLGRLYHAGFQVHDLIFDEGKYIIVAQKLLDQPSYLNTSSEGLFFKMARVGKDKKYFNVYKFRTMHPYSEYLQEYLMQTNGLDSNGKFKDDFRISTLGSFIRRYWIDELPMLYNLIRGDMKLVGVRPISKQYFNLYPDDLKRRRTSTKPGLLPPYYADMPNSFEEIIQSENAYLLSYEKDPFFTDLKYFFRILKNIFFKHARSK